VSDDRKDANVATAKTGFGIQEAEELAAFLAKELPDAADAKVLVVAGSGLGGLVRSVKAKKSVSYGDMPHVGASTVVGHSGNLVHGNIAGADGTAGAELLLMAGRRHLYEGIGAYSSTLLVRAILVAFPSIKSVIISNAAGGLNRTFDVGDLMLISDHINMTFKNPLIGPNRDDWGVRFPDASEIYSRRLRGLAREAALDLGLKLREGVYVAGHGPSYETRAEVGMLRHIIGGDAVGMSTALEALVCAHMGREVLGISFISNTLTEPAVTTHEEVMENSRKVEADFSRLVSRLVAELS